MKKNKLPYNLDSGFKVPDNYFADLTDRVMNGVNSVKIVDDSYLKKVSNSGFKVPEDYFENFEVELPLKEEKETKVIPLFSKRNLYYASAVAAIVIAIFSTIFLDSSPESTWDNVELSAIEKYIDAGYTDMSPSEITNFLYEGNYVVETNFDNVNPDAVYEYLNENVEDPAYILE
ncbi:hypothetical protein RM549_10520 [Salegentibacter sp. F188]|uniref:Uncharacterized protein n=1 Tax=Autumnicola patrickiae TaxID=3075591 RepID=A0ABU3E2J7_9FLAO|nr:hypothetical protein [Salegentibacter sp. F188]MDT0690219.1 hypothetical protein [Salegentibacter sp. F188]